MLNTEWIGVGLLYNQQKCYEQVPYFAELLPEMGGGFAAGAIKHRYKNRAGLDLLLFRALASRAGNSEKLLAQHCF